MSSVTKWLITGIATGLLTACGPAGDPESSVEEIPAVETATTDPQQENAAPQITSDPVTESLPGLPYIYQPTVLDPDGDPLVWSLTQAPTGMQINPKTGLMAAEFLPTGRHPVRLQVKDTEGRVDEQSFIIELPSKPVIVSVPPRYTYTGTDYSYQVDVLSASGTALQYAVNAGPPGMSIDPDGLLQWTANLKGQVEVILTVADATGGVAEQQFTIDVLSEDDIIIVSTPVTEAFIFGTYEYRLSALAGNYVDSWSLEEAPAGMTIDTANVINWTPTAEGRFSVRVVAANNSGTRTTQEFEIAVSSQEED